MKNAILASLIVLLGIVMASDSAVETQLRTLTAWSKEFRNLQTATEVDDGETGDTADAGDTAGAGSQDVVDDEVKEDVAIPWDAWLSWGIGGFLSLFIIGSIIWRVGPKCCKK